MKLLPTALIALAAAIAGFTIGRSNKPPAALHPDPVNHGSLRSALDTTDDPPDGAADPERLPGSPGSPAEAARQIRALLSQKQSVRRDLQFSLAALALDAASIPTVWAELEALSNFTDYSNEHELTKALLTRWAEIDPLSAMEATSDLNSWMQYTSVSTIAGTWAKKDPDGAIAWIENSTNSRHREYAMEATLNAVGETDRARALALYFKAVAEKILPIDRWSGSEMFSSWARDDPAAASAGAFEVFEKTKSDAALRGALGAWAMRDTPGSLDWLEKNLSGDTQRRVFESVVETWAVREPEAAAKHVLALEDRQLWQSAVGEVVRNWAMRDFENASQWIDAIGDSDRQDEARAALIRSGAWAGSDLDAANYALPYLDSQKTKDALTSLAWNWGRRDPDGSMAWFEENIEDKAVVDNLRFRLIDQKTWNNPAHAAESLADLPEGKRRDEAYSNVAENWAESNLDAARSWVNELPEGTGRDLALSSVTGAWIEQDTQSATTWINEMEPGDLRDQMTAKLVGYHADEADMDTALETASQIEDPHWRANTFESALRTWMYRDVEAATKYIESSQQLDAQTRWRLLTPR